MKLLRKWLVMGLTVMVLGAFAEKAMAEEGQFEREPASKSSSKHHAKKKKKNNKKTAKGKSKAGSARAHKRNHGARAKTHYPTQPGGSGFSDVSSEKKDDLPPPQTQPTAN